MQLLSSYITKNHKRQHCSSVLIMTLHPHTHTHSHIHAPFDRDYPRGLVPEETLTHPLTPILIIRHSLWTSSVFCDPQHPPCSIYMLDSPFPQRLSRSSLVYLLVWNPLLHTPCISSPNHYLLFATHAHTITTCFAVVPRLSSIPNLFLRWQIHLTIHNNNRL